ncbi:MAG: hypothetical protein HY907_01640 [Deltaproteobacteria bacterium]|nr:hypothetical protein [Deltaproteobacteria bacterium]
MVEKAVGFKGKVKNLVLQGLAGLALIAVAWLALSFLVGLVKWVVSMVVLLAAGYVVWRIFKAVVL